MLLAWSLAGHPPSIEWMTTHLEVFVAGVSVLREISHKPPPWTDSPKEESFCEAPTAILVTVPSELLAILHGKFGPSVLSGLLSKLPYGGGVAMIMCPWAVETKRAMAQKGRIGMIEDMWIGMVVASCARRVSGLDFSWGCPKNNHWILRDVIFLTAEP